MRIIARKTLTDFVESLAGHKDQQAVRTALHVWFHEVSAARWENASDIKRRYVTASIISAERIVFNIKGNDYRMVVAVDFGRQIVWIKWVGNHRDYDRIDVRSVKHER